MAQHDYSIANDSGANVRSDINDLAAAVLSQNSGTSAPSTTAAGMVYLDTTKGHYRRRNSADSGWLPFAPGASTMVQAKSASYTVAEGDHDTVIDCTSTFTLALTAAATLGDGFKFGVRNSGTGVITIDPSGSETVDAATTIAVQPGESFTVHCTGSAFKTIGRNTAAGDVTLKSANETASAGPTLTFDRNSASPAASDVMGQISFVGRDNAGNIHSYADIIGVISVPTNGSEAGFVSVRTSQAGSGAASRLNVGAGAWMEGATGTDKGAGTFNATALYDDGTQVTDYVFDVLLDGKAKPEDGALGAKFDARYLDPAEFEAFWRANRHLPAMPSREEWRKGSLPVGALIQRLWETVEVLAVHNAALSARVAALEAKS